VDQPGKWPVSISTGSTQVWWIIQKREPIVGTQVDTGNFVRAFTFAWPTLELVHIEPQNEQVQEQLPAGQIRTLTPTCQVRAQNAIDGFSSATGSHRSFEQGQ